MKPVEEKRILLALYEAAGHPDGEEDVRRFIAALGQPGMWVPGYALPSPWVYSLLVMPSRPET